MERRKLSHEKSRRGWTASASRERQRDYGGLRHRAQVLLDAQTRESLSGPWTGTLRPCGCVNRQRNRQNQAMPKGGRRSTSWKRGQSGNRGGHPKRSATIEAHKIIADVKAAARELTPQALGTLQEIMEDKKAPPAARVTAATEILSRGWGRPATRLEAEAEMGL
jgi:hypothetical protein